MACPYFLQIILFIMSNFTNQLSLSFIWRSLIDKWLL